MGKRKNHNSKLIKGSRAARVSVMFLIALSLGLAGLGLVAGSAEAVSFADDGYVNQLMTGNTSNGGGWNENVIISQDPSLQGTDADSLVKSVSGFFNGLAVAIISVAFVLSAARLAGRGVYEMFCSTPEDRAGISMGKKSVGGIPSFFQTSEERKSKKTNTEWVRPMLMETGMFLGVAIFVGAILAALSGIALMLLTQGEKAYNSSAGH